VSPSPVGAALELAWAWSSSLRRSSPLGPGPRPDGWSSTSRSPSSPSPNPRPQRPTERSRSACGSPPKQPRVSRRRSSSPPGCASIRPLGDRCRGSPVAGGGSADGPASGSAWTGWGTVGPPDQRDGRTRGTGPGAGPPALAMGRRRGCRRGRTVRVVGPARDPDRMIRVRQGSSSCRVRVSSWCGWGRRVGTAGVVTARKSRGSGARNWWGEADMPGRRRVPAVVDRGPEG